MNNIKLIVTDMDGTLLNSHKQISEFTQNTLKKAQQQGIGVVLATGRGMIHLGEYIHLLNMDSQPLSGFISLNGLELYDYQKHSLISHPKLTNSDVVPFYHAIKDTDTTLLVFYQNALIRVTDRYIDETNFLEIKDLETVGIEELYKYDQPILKIALCGETVAEVVQTFSKEIQDNYDICRVEDTWIEINPYGITKGKGLKDYLAYHQLTLDQVVVFGNGENDTSMLEIAQNSVAPENAMESVKAVCQYRCGHHDEDGVAKFIEEYILKDASNAS